MAQPSTLDPIYFWKPHGSWPGFMSQWFESIFKDKENEYNTAESYMMFQKAALFGDEKIARKILEAKTPKEQKALGQQVKNFDSKKWDRHKLSIVEEGNFLKFTQCSEKQGGKQVPLKDLLLETGDRELVEASPFDRIWGIGYSPKDAPNSLRETWGENLLGKALMNVRARLREEQMEKETDK